MPDDLVHETAGLRFELAGAPLAGTEDESIDRIPWQEQVMPRPACSLSVGEDDGLFWAEPAPGEVPGGWRCLTGPQTGALGFRFVRRAFATALVLVSLRKDVFVNGAPALGMTVLELKDTVLLAGPRLMFYLTQRFRPAVGPPPQQFLGQKCPACSLTFDSGTALVSCACGAAYHHETAQSHPDLPGKDRLDCFSRVGKCQNCKHDLTTEEYLVWDSEGDG
ncbi:MAG: hypothetical protein RBS80_14610 [Thermoguttaceae bacterium]|jgi:hypothetical protein|nr:hypothetical protein [Thermoguttaceae bacterium]